jgi:hypothetical protein
MFNKIQADLAKLFGKQTIPVVIFLVLCIGLYFYSNSKTFVMDKLTNPDSYNNSAAAPSDSHPAPASSSVESSGASNYEAKDIANPTDLLPKDMNSEWAKLNPVGSNQVVGSDLLDAKAFMGQVSQYKGIMNQDIRAWPVIEKREVSPWLQSTLEPDIHKTGIQCTN